MGVHQEQGDSEPSGFEEKTRAVNGDIKVFSLRLGECQSNWWCGDGSLDSSVWILGL